MLLFGVLEMTVNTAESAVAVDSRREYVTGYPQAFV